MSRATFAARPMSRWDAEREAERILRRMFPEHLRLPTRLNVIRMLDGLEDAYGIMFAVEDLDPGEEGFTHPIECQIVIDTGVYKAAERGEGRGRLRWAGGPLRAHHLRYQHHAVALPRDPPLHVDPAPTAGPAEDRCGLHDATADDDQARAVGVAPR